MGCRGDARSPEPSRDGCDLARERVNGLTIVKRTQLALNRKTSSGPGKQFIWLGKYLSLALTLPASVAAGYILGTVADYYFQHPLLRAIGIIVGMMAGLVQIIRELAREEQK